METIVWLNRTAKTANPQKEPGGRIQEIRTWSKMVTGPTIHGYEGSRHETVSAFRRSG